MVGPGPNVVYSKLATAVGASAAHAWSAARRRHGILDCTIVDIPEYAIASGSSAP